MKFISLIHLVITSTYNVPDARISYGNLELKNAVYAINELYSMGKSN